MKNSLKAIYLQGEKTLNIGIIGGSEFTLGFELTGIRDIVKIPDKTDGNQVVDMFREIILKENIGILVTDDKTMDMIPKEFHEMLENASRPVLVILSDKGLSSSLSDRIKNSLGVTVSI
ncbi:MAG: hypothetical protein KKF44_00700 [Nanoarchaeota archaeon]|nr:hypothetical protein [Nanoarchaeota archaeon]